MNSRIGFNLLKHPELLLQKHSWKWNKKTMFFDTITALICLLRGHRICTTDDFNDEQYNMPTFVCGFTIIKHYWLACIFCHTYLSKEKLTKRDRLIMFHKRSLT